MNTRMIVPLLFGLGGIAILLALGIWQMQRLAWKENILSQIETRMKADPVALPATPNADTHNRLRVKLTGELEPNELHILTSIKGEGPGFRVIAPLRLPDGSRIMLDRGFIPESAKSSPRKLGKITITGALLWPNETDGYTPEPNIERNIWFARETETMAQALNTRPLLLVTETSDPPSAARPLPITLNIPNNHLEYAITWFSLSIVWFGMTCFLLWRIRTESKSS